MCPTDYTNCAFMSGISTFLTSPLSSRDDFTVEKSDHPSAVSPGHNWLIEPKQAQIQIHTYSWNDVNQTFYILVKFSISLFSAFFFEICVIFYVNSDFFSIFRGNPNVTLTLSWNIIPNAGRLPIIQSIGSHSFKFPSEYTTDRL